MDDTVLAIGDDEDDKKGGTSLDTELGKRRKIEDELLELYEGIDKAYLAASDRINDQLDFWDMYNCRSNDNQFYQGNASIYVPLVRDAIDARVTRLTNQLFPPNSRCIDCITSDPELPSQRIALLEHYTETSHLRDQVVPAVLRNGDVEGQWNLYVSWNKSERKVRYKVKKQVEFEGIEIEGAGDIEDIEEQTIPAMTPYVEVIPDSDVMVLPHTADSIEDALARGGSVTILRRWSKADVKRMMKDGDFIKSRGEDIVDAFSPDKRRTDAKKKHVDQAGIVSGSKYTLGYETWTMLEVDGEKVLCRAYFGSPTLLLGVKQNPFWCNLCPLISAPQVKISGVFKGIPPVSKVATFQYTANDFMNEAADSATYALLPIIMTDPMRNPRVGSMVMDLAAVWEVDPNSTKFASFPPLWKDGIGLVAECKNQVFQSLGVNPSMIPGQTGGKNKRSQAEVANEQQVDILTTNDVGVYFETAIMTPLIQRIAWYDAQFRDKEISIRMFGRAGMRASMQVVEPIQMDTRDWYCWVGSEAARNSQQIQQQISLMNILVGIPPEKYPGRQIDLVPLIERIVENGFGPTLGPLVFRNQTDLLSIDPMEENEMLQHGFPLPISPLDNDVQHLQLHQQLMQMGDPHGNVRVHMAAHMQQMQAKQQQAQVAAQGQPGKPGGAGPGVAGTPKPGATPMQPHAAKSPPGAIHPDKMPLSMPRKMG